jgi:hypothetical protein
LPEGLGTTDLPVKLVVICNEWFGQLSFAVELQQKEFVLGIRSAKMPWPLPSSSVLFFMLR